MNSTALSVSVRDAALFTSFSEYEIRKAINEGSLVAVRLGRRISIPVENLTAWLQSLPKTNDAA